MFVSIVIEKACLLLLLECVMILIILYVEFAEIASFHGKFGVIQYQVMQLTQITGAV